MSLAFFAGATWLGREPRPLGSPTATPVGARSRYHSRLFSTSYNRTLEEMSTAGICRLWDRAVDPTQTTNLCARAQFAGVVMGLLKMLREHLKGRLPGHPALTVPWLVKRASIVRAMAAAA